MKIRKVAPEHHVKVSALLRKTFPGSNREMQLVENLRKNGKIVCEWVGIHTNRVIAYVAFTKAFNNKEVCGLHLGPLAVTPEFQHQGVGTEVLRFALRQDVIKEDTVFVVGNPAFYQKFGFVLCEMPLSHLANNKALLLGIRNAATSQFKVKYEPEFRV